MLKYYKEYFFFPDIFIISVIFLTGLVINFYHYTSPWIWVAFVIGGVIFSIHEYLVHRFFFHLKPPKNMYFLNILKRLHYDHHEDHNELKLIFLPLWFTVPQFVFITVAAYFITNNFYLSVSFLTGAIIYHLHYEWRHYLAHRPISPKTKWGKNLKKHHLLHHYKSEHYWFGVTNLTYDRMMGTYQNERNIPLSATARRLLSESVDEKDESSKVV